MENLRKGFSMSNMRIRNMFLLVTALSVMFFLACGQSDEECESLQSGAYTGLIFNEIYEIEAIFEAQIDQVNCSIRGNIKIGQPLLGSGSFEGNINTNKVDFVIADKVMSNNVKYNLIFQGEVTEDSTISGTYKAPEVTQNGIWNLTLVTEDTLKESNRLLEQGEQFLDSEDYHGALESINKAIEANPKNAGAYFLKGLLYFNLGDMEFDTSDDSNYIFSYTKAIYNYSKVIELNPNDVEAHFFRGINYYYLGNAQLSLKDFDKAIELDSNYKEAIDGRKKILEEYPELNP